MIKLLIEIRTPKLSKDGFKPSIITEIMSNSLRGLSDEDLKAVSESIENMNKTKEQLEMLEISNKSLKQVMTPYDNYNKRMLYDKAKNYDSIQKRYIKTQKEAKEVIDKLKKAEETLEEQENKKQELEKELQIAKFKEKELKSNELWKKKEEQAEIEKQIVELNEELKQKETQEEYKKSIIRKKENKENYENELNNFFKQILEENKETTIYSKLKEIIESKNHIYYNLKKYYNKNYKGLYKELKDACNGINNLPIEKTRIPVFASNITGNPHGFDKNSTCGKIFIMLICYIEETRYPKSIEELAEIYYKHNLLIDDVSNMILCKNAIGFIKNEKNEYIEHQGLKEFAKKNEPIYLNLYNLSNIAYLAKPTKYKEIIVMENPTVFMEVAERCNKKDFPLVCTYGQVKLSGLILLDMYVKQGYKICYSGDIDPEGIQIADKLKSRYKENLKFIGFDLETYNKNMSNVKISESRLKKLDNI